MYLKKLVAGIICGALVSVSMMQAVYSSDISTDFDIDSELLKCIVETNLFDYDENKDGVISEEEFGNSYGIQIDAKGYDIKDWSALSLGKDWQIVSIENFPGGDLSYLSALTNLNNVHLTLTDDAEAITGLAKLEQVSTIEISTAGEFDFNQLKDCINLNSIDVDANSFINLKSLESCSTLNNLSLNVDSLSDIEIFPVLSNLKKLDLEITNLNDDELTEILRNCNNINELSVRSDLLATTDWLRELTNTSIKCIDLSNNNIADVTGIIKIITDSSINVANVKLQGNPLSEKSRTDLLSSIINKNNFFKGNVGDMLEVYDTLMLQIDIINKDDISLSVADDNMAKIEGNYIKLLNAGSTKLVAVCNDISVECDVIILNNEATVVSSDILVGDVNLDEVISAEDALKVLKHAARIEELEAEQLNEADVNNDDIIDSDDALEILRIAAMLSEKRERTVYEIDLTVGEKYVVDNIFNRGSYVWTFETGFEDLLEVTKVETILPAGSTPGDVPEQLFIVKALENGNAKLKLNFESIGDSDDVKKSIVYIFNIE